jgi:hypothetical protein
MIIHHFKATTLRLIIQLINTGLGVYFYLILTYYIDLYCKNNGYILIHELVYPILIIVTIMIFVAKPRHKVNYISYVPELDKEYLDNFIEIHIPNLFVFFILSIMIAASYIPSDWSSFWFLIAFLSFVFILYTKYAVYKRNILFLSKILIIPKVKIKTSYFDYINKNIEDDEPHLELNQLFTFQVKEHFRNSKEEKEITILNPKTPNKPAKVMMLESNYLADHIRKGYKLKAKLIEILPNTELIIEIEREENRDDNVYQRLSKT